jgi:hypothetical protein
MMEVESSVAHNMEQPHDENHTDASEAVDIQATRQLELEQLAAEATSRLNDALLAVNQLIEPSEPCFKPVVGWPFHPKTGKVRKPREQDASDDDDFGRGDSSDDDYPVSDLAVEVERMDAGTQIPKTTPAKRGRPASAKPNPADVRWVSSAAGRYGVNKPKCPPCARLKKKDPCNGQAPCRQCWGKGRRTPEECQEWGENYVPKIRKRRGPQPGHKNAKKISMMEEE